MFHLSDVPAVLCSTSPLFHLSHVPSVRCQASLINHVTDGPSLPRLLCVIKHVLGSSSDRSSNCLDVPPDSCFKNTCGVALRRSNCLEVGAHIPHGWVVDDVDDAVVDESVRRFGLPCFPCFPFNCITTAIPFCCARHTIDDSSLCSSLSLRNPSPSHEVTLFPSYSSTILPPMLRLL